MSEVPLYTPHERPGQQWRRLANTFLRACFPAGVEGAVDAAGVVGQGGEEAGEGQLERDPIARRLKELLPYQTQFPCTARVW